MPGSHLNRLVPLLQQVLPPDTTGETLEHVCAQVVLWMYLSTSPTREASMLKELASMGAKLTRGEPGSLGTFKLEIDHGTI